MFCSIMKAHRIACFYPGTPKLVSSYFALRYLRMECIVQEIQNIQKSIGCLAYALPNPSVRKGSSFLGDSGVHPRKNFVNLAKISLPFCVNGDVQWWNNFSAVQCK